MFGRDAHHRGSDQRGIETLRAKRRNSVPFDQLGAEERYALAFGCACVRPNLFVYFVGILEFDLIQLSRDALGRLLVPPDVWRDSQGRFYPFSHYIMTQTDEVGDARLLGTPPNGYRSSPDPHRHPLQENRDAWMVTRNETLRSSPFGPCQRSQPDFRFVAKSRPR